VLLSCIPSHSYLSSSVSPHLYLFSIIRQHIALIWIYCSPKFSRESFLSLCTHNFSFGSIVIISYSVIFYHASSPLLYPFLVHLLFNYPTCFYTAFDFSRNFRGFISYIECVWSACVFVPPMSAAIFRLVRCGAMPSSMHNFLFW